MGVIAMTQYKVVVDDPFKNCEYIYPIQQRKVKEFVDYFKINKNVRSIMIFGSSVTERCHSGSDVDIYVTLDKNEKIIDKYFDFVYDLWTNFTVDKDLKEEIFKTGVLVYEQ